MKTIAIVGASVAGVRAAQALRQAGFDGRLTLLGDDPHAPYDRPPLSKAYLAGRSDEADLALLDDDDLADLSLDLRAGVRAVALDTAAGRVRCDDGTELGADGVVVATGGSARRLPGTEDVGGVHALRTLDDARALRAELVPGARVVVVGGGFIGAEVASTCRALGLPVTVLDGLPTPLSPVLGETLARPCVALHAEHGTTLHTGAAVEGLATASTADGGRRVTGVRLRDGREVPADVVVVGVGITPNTGWLQGSGVKVDQGARTDDGMVTDVPAVVAVGDVARWSRGPASHRHEHWTSAGEQAAVAAENLLAGATVRTVAPSGYVWSEQYGRMLQLAGHPDPADEVEILHGDVDERRFVARYRRADGTTTGLFAMADPRTFGRLRRTELPRPATR
ncbi:FAD-dependent oxidoreductase [Actinomycetospora corticicola]|uniref:3-phenylpropionate/trans-cinnamate dioxygenase ferredoxin reductase subunit n=1 Tax=Actinomycetospora corticicola TaxID=663602 RepID=A0A7Y9DVC7_9PSEU|nr:FAD-dependent oxidoreductase [Actinomycetospora corticicola]NYD36120.1 3-phenylpropionate/trans-cinnamate dioxygenase ferredoxin reductase subunit [Actinomycetospora corticicola]